MFPPRLSVMTLNLWNERRWDDRAKAVEACLQTVDPDLLCIQELRESTRDRLDAVLPGHRRVDDDFYGWTREGTIYWNDGHFAYVDHGSEDVGILEEYRRLFWVRLELTDADRTILVSTAHFTYQGNEHEVDTGQSPRVEQANRTVSALQDLQHEGEPVLFMGDLNDPVHPRRILADAGYTDCFSELGVPVRPTFPAWPTKDDADSIVEIPLDWIVANEHARSRCATVPEFFYEGMAPSDHWPVLAIYELD